jgi:hypothetical protein
MERTPLEGPCRIEGGEVSGGQMKASGYEGLRKSSSLRIDEVCKAAMVVLENWRAGGRVRQTRRNQVKLSTS